MFYSLICITKLNYLLGMQSNIKKFLHFFSSSVRMGGKSIIFNDKKTKKKKKNHKSKRLFNIDDIDVNKISISKK